jgi:UDP-glucose 4-epimerase
MNYVLVTGGLGFIGSHTVVDLLENNYRVIIVDNLSNSKLDVLDKIREIAQPSANSLLYFNIDITHLVKLEEIFVIFRIESIIHFASYKAVGESITQPLSYYHNNLQSTLNLLSLCEKYKTSHFIFSSSATVYGNSESPLIETSPVGQALTSPYGKTKYFIEEILADFHKSKTSTKIIILRYFNPVGAHPSGLIGENPNGIPNNLMPYILNVAVKNNIDPSIDDIYSTVKVYGNTYKTRDGTGERDFIHVVDLANAHCKSLEYLQNNDVSFDICNVGTGKPTSVLELIETFSKINGVCVPYEIYPKRMGDLASVYCDTNKSANVLKWYPKYDITDMCKHAYRYCRQLV